jgi:hypothetical protein
MNLLHTFVSYRKPGSPRSFCKQKKAFNLPIENNESENMNTDQLKMANIYNLQLEGENLHLIGNSLVGKKTQLRPLNPLKDPPPLLDHEVRGTTC